MVGHGPQCETETKLWNERPKRDNGGENAEQNRACWCCHRLLSEAHREVNAKQVRKVKEDRFEVSHNTICTICGRFFAIFVTSHGKTYTNGYPLKRQKAFGIRF